MDILEQLSLINHRIDNLSIHVQILKNDILNNPDADIPGKQSRASVMLDIELAIEALVQEKNTLTNQI